MIWITVTFEVNESSGDWDIQNRSFVVIVIFYLFTKIKVIEVSSIYDEPLHIMFIIWEIVLYLCFD